MKREECWLHARLYQVHNWRHYIPPPAAGRSAARADPLLSALPKPSAWLMPDHIALWPTPSNPALFWQTCDACHCNSNGERKDFQAITKSFLMTYLPTSVSNVEPHASPQECGQHAYCTPCPNFMRELRRGLVFE